MPNLPHAEDLRGKCGDPMEHSMWCRCGEVSEPLKARIAELEQQKSDIPANSVPLEQYKNMVESLRLSHARETELNRKIFDLRNSQQRMRKVINTAQLMLLPFPSVMVNPAIEALSASLRAEPVE